MGVNRSNLNHPASIALIVLSVWTAPALAEAGSERVEEHVRANDQLVRAIEDRALKSSDPEEYYARIDRILTETSASPNVQMHLPAVVDSKGNVSSPERDDDSYVAHSFGSVTRDFRLAGLLLRHGADPRFSDDNRSAPYEKAAIGCDASAMALLRFNGFDPTIVEQGSIWAATLASDAFFSTVLSTDIEGRCEATRAVASMPLPQLAAWIRFPDPPDEELFLRLYSDGELAEIMNARLYAGATVDAVKAGLPMISEKEAWIRMGVSQKTPAPPPTPGVNPENQMKGGIPRDPDGAPNGAKESMAPSPSRPTKAGPAGP